VSSYLRLRSHSGKCVLSPTLGENSHAGAADFILLTGTGFWRRSIALGWSSTHMQRRRGTWALAGALAAAASVCLGLAYAWWQSSGYYLEWDRGDLSVDYLAPAGASDKHTKP
jgi:hypothetical protein